MQITQSITSGDCGESGEKLGRIMIVEDDALLSMMMEDMIRELGVEDVVVCPDHATAFETATTGEIACGVLDVLVHGRPTYDVADILTHRGVPIMFCSGLSAADIDERHRHRPLLSKPYGDDDLRECLNRALGMSR